MTGAFYCELEGERVEEGGLLHGGQHGEVLRPQPLQQPRQSGLGVGRAGTGLLSTVGHSLHSPCVLGTILLNIRK